MKRTLLVLSLLACASAAYAINVMGSAPICTFDGYIYQCYYYTWDACENANMNPNARCVSHP